MTAKVHALLKWRDSAFRAGDKAALKKARAKLSRTTRETKSAHAQRIHGHFQDSGDSRRMWQGIQAITNYKTTPSACDSDVSLPDALNDFYAQFETQNSIAARKIIPPNHQHLIEKLSLLGLNTSLCNWFLDFLTGRPQSVRLGNSISSTTTLSTGAPQGCALSPLLFNLLTHDCSAMHSSNHITKFGNEMTSSVEIVKSTKFLGVHLVENFTWSLNISSISISSLLWRLRKAHLPPPILTMFYRGTIESIMSSYITAWFGNCAILDHKTLQWIVRTAEKIIGVFLPSITDMYTTRCIRKSSGIVDDPTHPSHTLHRPAVWKE
ncbi:hypothetical protein QTP70_021269, partial [Hemibagrus guttatus]